MSVSRVTVDLDEDRQVVIEWPKIRMPESIYPFELRFVVQLVDFIKENKDQFAKQEDKQDEAAKPETPAPGPRK